MGIKPMGLSAPMADSPDNIFLWPVEKLIGINPMILSAPWASSLDIIALGTIKKY